jgi:site-specific DNA recombinase
MPNATPIVRCAIYTRKSTEEGLEQEFNSLHAQREAGEAFIKSQKHVGWTLILHHYDDGGFTGGNLDRPALQRLLEDIDDRQIDCILVYKVDRLSRSLLDFARLVDCFDQHSVSFVSVTQQFNTTTSLGRLKLNILLSFAQFEREIISERTSGPEVWGSAAGIPRSVMVKEGDSRTRAIERWFPHSPPETRSLPDSWE